MVSMRAAIFVELARMTGESQWWDRSIKARRLIAQRDPQGNVAWERLGHALWEGGRPDAAREAY